MRRSPTRRGIHPQEVETASKRRRAATGQRPQHDEEDDGERRCPLLVEAAGGAGNGQAPSSMIQRRLRVGYSRAPGSSTRWRQRGIVSGPFEGSKSRNAAHHPGGLCQHRFRAKHGPLSICRKHGVGRGMALSLGCAKTGWTARSCWGISSARATNRGRSGEQAEVIDRQYLRLHPVRPRRRPSTPSWRWPTTKGTGRAIPHRTGCLTERYPEELSAELPELDALLGVGQYLQMGDLFARLERGERVLWTGDNQTLIEVSPAVLTTPPGRAYLKIGEGCDNRCAYCAIPRIRGALPSAVPWRIGAAGGPGAGGSGRQGAGPHRPGYHPLRPGPGAGTTWRRWSERTARSVASRVRPYTYSGRVTEELLDVLEGEKGCAPTWISPSST